MQLPTRCASLVGLAVLAVPLLAVDIPESMLKAFAPLPAVMESPNNPLTPDKVELGRMLYFEPRLSKNQKISCNSCHDVARFGVDNEPTSEGHKGQRGDRNSPTSFNAAGHFVQFWDGRAPDVEAQAKGPILNPVEMAMPEEKVVIQVLKSIPEYVTRFQKAFPGEADAVTYDNMAKAIGAFERKLVTPARWDKFLSGDKSALTNAEKTGFIKFTEAGCVACHSGTYLGGQQYQKLGAVKPWPSEADLGRMKVTNAPSDKMVFKVPSLRNIAKTGPYFHDGKVDTLDKAVNLMAEHNLGRKLNKKDVGSILAFMNTLTGDIPAELKRTPQLPPSTAQTPKPDPTN